MGLEEHLLYCPETTSNSMTWPARRTWAMAPPLGRARADRGNDFRGRLDQRGPGRTVQISFFVRGKARRNTEQFASAQGIALIKLETLYDARSHFAR